MFRIIRSKETSKLQWFRDPSDINSDNLNNLRCEASRRFRNKKREYLKYKLNYLPWNCKENNIRDLYSFMKKFEKVPG
jgi:hypothetical protein